MNTLEKARSILSKALSIPIEKISADTMIDSLYEINSMNFAAAMVDIEQHLGHSIDPIKLLELRSVKDLVAILEGG
jgi:acyl carrier protein